MSLALIDPSKYLLWITTRAAGTVALILASAAVGVGLAMATGVLKRGGADRRVVHEILSLSAIAAILAHVLSLLADSYLHPTVLDVTVPFVFSYKTIATSVGIVAGWGIVLLGLSYYARRWIGQRRWRSLHRLTALVWVLGLVHAFTEGTDAGRWWFIALVAIAAAPATLLLAFRILRGRGGRATRPSRLRNRALAEQYG